MRPEQIVVAHQRAAAIAHLRELGALHRVALADWRANPAEKEYPMFHWYMKEIMQIVAAYRAIGVLPPARNK